MARVPLLFASALVAFAGMQGSALASELVLAQAGEVPSIEQGETTQILVEARAVGDISCGAHQGNPGLARLETVFSLVDGQAVAGGAPGDPLPFYREDTAQPPPAGGCPVTWDTAPDPYRVSVLVAASPDTSPGEYEIPLLSTLGGKTDALRDDVPSSATVRVVPGAAPPPPPAAKAFVPPLAGPTELPPPRENRTVNLVPLQGDVVISYPRSATKVRIQEPVQVPAGTRVDADAGYVEVISDRNGRGAPQQATFWNDAFAVDYTRVVTPGARRGRRRRASNPITELKLTGRCASSTRLSRPVFSRRYAVSAARRKRRGLFGSGKGRFRTRGRYGAGTVRGTTWYTENRCDGTLFEVTSGVVNVRDFGLGRTVSVRRGQGYLAAPHHPREGESRD